MSERLMWSGVRGVGDLKAGTLVQSLCQSVKLTKWQKKRVALAPLFANSYSIIINYLLINKF